MSNAAFPDPIPEILPFRTLTIFAGAPGVGKTTMFYEWMRRWRTGKPIWGHLTNSPTHFYYVSADRGQTERQFFDSLGFTDGVTFYSVVESTIDHTNFHRDAHGAQLTAHVISELQPIPGSHLIIDPMAPLFITGNQNRTRDVAASLIGFSRLTRERNINITGTWHFAKQKADKNDRYKRPQDRISGNGAVSGFSDTQIYLIDPEPPKQPYHILGWNPRYTAPQEFPCVRVGDTFVSYKSLEDVGVGEDSPAEADTNLTNAGRLYQLLLTLGPLTPTEIVVEATTKLKLSRASVYRLIRVLRMDGRTVIHENGVVEAKPLS